MNTAEKGKRPATRRAAQDWRRHNAGRILGDALFRFESRVMALMARAGYTETRLSHVNLTRHLDLDGTRITELASRARMTNAAMTELVDQCVRLGLVRREADPADGRVRRVCFTEAGRRWLQAFGRALRQTERELRREIGEEAAAMLYGSLADYAAEVRSIGSQE